MCSSSALMPGISGVRAMESDVGKRLVGPLEVLQHSLFVHTGPLLVPLGDRQLMVVEHRIHMSQHLFHERQGNVARRFDRRVEAALVRSLQQRGAEVRLQQTRAAAGRRGPKAPHTDCLVRFDRRPSAFVCVPKSTLPLYGVPVNSILRDRSSSGTTTTTHGVSCASILAFQVRVPATPGCRINSLAASLSIRFSVLTVNRCLPLPCAITWNATSPSRLFARATWKSRTRSGRKSSRYVPPGRNVRLCRPAPQVIM
jgi:hypothetical protein